MKKILFILTLSLTLAAPMRAQVFVVDDEDEANRNVLGANGTWNNVIFHGSPDDQTNYLPLDCGVLALSILGGAYLLGKRKNEKK